MSIEPPRPKGPPLNALRAFEAAARLGSFKLAANELCVTSGAIAQHIKALEEWTRTPLFHRHAQGVELTLLGQEILPKFVSAFDHLGEAIHALKSSAQPLQIRIAALPAIAQLWLSPKLPEIRKNFPDLQISVTAMETPPNLSRESFDLSIFYGAELEGNTETALGPDSILPICSPDIASKLKEFSHLQSVSLLHDQVWKDDWQHWLNKFSPQISNMVSGPSYSLYSLVVEEAIHGAGVMMGRKSLMSYHLAQGALVTPFDEELPCDEQIIITVAKPVANNANIKKMIELLTQK